MNVKITIRKVLFVVVWLCIGGAMITLLLAAISSKRNGVCTNYNIILKGTVTNAFITRKDVEEILKKALDGQITGKPVEKFKLYELEMLLEKNPWISKAEIYFDNKDILNITIEGKEPVARIFTTNGASFYLDNTGGKMPLTEKRTARVPVFTGFPDKQLLNATDSMLLQQVKSMAVYIKQEPFWMAQVAQIDITQHGQFEMIPVVGNHLVKLGNGDNMDVKFRRLMIFYQQVLAKTGFDKYKLIDVQYKGQVVAEKYSGNTRVDSVQLKKNVEKLLRLSTESSQDTVVKVLPTTKHTESDINQQKNNDVPVEKTKNTEKQNNPNPGLELSNPSAIKKADGQAVKRTIRNDNKNNPGQTRNANEQPKNKQKPKAVMPKKVTVDEYGGYN